MTKKKAVLESEKPNPCPWCIGREVRWSDGPRKGKKRLTTAVQTLWKKGHTKTMRATTDAIAVFCWNCGCRGPVHTTERAAIRAWNRVAKPTPRKRCPSCGGAQKAATIAKENQWICRDTFHKTPTPRPSRKGRKT